MSIDRIAHDFRIIAGDGEFNDGNELLVDNSIAPAEVDSALPVTFPCDEVDSAINSNLVSTQSQLNPDANKTIANA